ncbi:orf75 [Sucra jujuba nucleopolyhedrovirus]|uniref:Orf75 n=1 Tax=Sucra jujuba nucleopolyhedrovirus TaxID=1563660 RepID=A0A097P937_9ABAC|nr:orf75 [Sucra jujuba nucleopolyhedrovirus]AIU41314.1 orf75 [Sucra jujuba nucleopolyhedrovirus]
MSSNNIDNTSNDDASIVRFNYTLSWQESAFMLLAAVPIEFTVIVEDVELELDDYNDINHDELQNGGTSQEPIEYGKHLKKMKSNSTEIFNNSCGVCLEDFKKSELVSVLTNCMHAFCVQCIDGWLAKSNLKYCPICRSSIK